MTTASLLGNFDISALADEKKFRHLGYAPLTHRA